MEQVIEKIWSYGTLSSEERIALDAFVSVNATYAPLLEDSKRLHNLLREASVFTGDSFDDVALAYLVAHDQATSGILPSALEGVYRQLHKKIEAMPQAKKRYLKVRARMEEIAMHSDPVSQFEQLTGYSMGGDKEEQVVPEVNSVWAGAKDRPGVARKHLARTVRWGIRSAMALAACMVFIFIGYYTNRIARSAYTSTDVLLVEEVLEERGLGDYSPPVSPDVVFTFAQRAIHESQKIWFGMYYTYDQDKLEIAEQLLGKVRQDSLASSFLREESTYLLAKVYMAQKEYTEAAQLLDELISLRSRRLEEALKLRSLL